MATTVGKWFGGRGDAHIGSLLGAAWQNWLRRSQEFGRAAFRGGPA